MSDGRRSHSGMPLALASVPLFRAGLTLGAIVPIALATDTVSITIMEFVANATKEVAKTANTPGQ